jgi:hypothetical protein
MSIQLSQVERLMTIVKNLKTTENYMTLSKTENFTPLATNPET